MLQTGQTDRETGQRPDSIGRTVLQTVAQKHRCCIILLSTVIQANLITKWPMVTCWRNSVSYVYNSRTLIIINVHHVGATMNMNQLHENQFSEFW